MEIKRNLLVKQFLKLSRGLLYFVALIFSLSSYAAADLSLESTAFNPADSGRSEMDVGGAWNGTTEVTSTTGDTFKLTVNNSNSGTTAFNVDLSVKIPTGIINVPANLSVSLSGTGCGTTPIISSSLQTFPDRRVNFSLDSGAYDLPADCSIEITYGLYADYSAGAQTHTLNPTWDWEESEGGGFQGAQFGSQSVDTREGALTIDVSPLVQTKKVGETASYTFSACNSGLGGLFDVKIDESAIGANLTITSMTQSPTAGVPAATGSSPILTAGYIPVGACFDVVVEATVDDCTELANEATTNDRNADKLTDITASIDLDVETPDISYSPSVLNVPAAGTTSHSKF